MSFKDKHSYTKPYMAIQGHTKQHTAIQYDDSVPRTFFVPWRTFFVRFRMIPANNNNKNNNNNNKASFRTFELCSRSKIFLVYTMGKYASFFVIFMEKGKF